MTFIKHKNNRDVCFCILSDRTVVHDDAIELLGVWWNIAMNPPFEMWTQSRPCREIIKIKRSDYHNWQEFESAEDARKSRGPNNVINF